MATLVTLDTVKEHLRKTTDEEDAVIAAYRTAAIAYVEKYTGHLLTQREVTDAFPAWGAFLTLRHQPITVGDPTPTLEVTYLDGEGDAIEYEDRVIRDQTYPWTIHPPYNSIFPTVAASSTITVTYTAGYAAGQVPDELNAAVLLLCGHWYSERAAETPAALSQLATWSGLPYPVVANLLRPFRGAVMA